MKADSSTYRCLPKILFFLTCIQTSHKKRPVLVMDTSFASLGCPLRASLVPIFSWMYNTIPVYPFTILQFFIASSSCIADLFYNGNIQEITGMWVNYQEFWYSLVADEWSLLIGHAITITKKLLWNIQYFLKDYCLSTESKFYDIAACYITLELESGTQFINPWLLFQ